MIKVCRAPVVALFPVLFMISCSAGQAPPMAGRNEAQPAASGEPQINTVKQLKFPGGTFKDGIVTVDPGYKVEPGPQKNVVMLRANNNTTFSCFCVLEGGDCVPLSTDNPDGSINLTCVSFNCASGKPPFCFEDIQTEDGFNIRVAVAGMKVASP